MEITLSEYEKAIEHAYDRGLRDGRDIQKLEDHVQEIRVWPVSGDECPPTGSVEPPEESEATIRKLQKVQEDEAKQEAALEKKKQEYAASSMPWWFPHPGGRKDYVEDYLEETAARYKHLANAYLALRAGIEDILSARAADFTVHSVADKLNKLLEFSE